MLVKKEKITAIECWLKTKYKMVEVPLIPRIKC